MFLVRLLFLFPQGRIKGGTGGPGPRAPHIKGPPTKRGKEGRKKKRKKKKKKERKKEKKRKKGKRKEKKKGKKKREKREVKKKGPSLGGSLAPRSPTGVWGPPGQTGSRCLSKPILTGHHLNV